MKAYPVAVIMWIPADSWDEALEEAYSWEEYENDVAMDATRFQVMGPVPNMEPEEYDEVD